MRKLIFFSAVLCLFLASFVAAASAQPNFVANGGSAIWDGSSDSFSLSGWQLAVSGSGPQLGGLGYAIPGNYYSGFLALGGGWEPAEGSGTAGGMYYPDLAYTGGGVGFTVFVPLGDSATVTTFAPLTGPLFVCAPGIDCIYGGGMQVFSVDMNIPGKLTLGFVNQGELAYANFTAVPEPGCLALVSGGITLLIGVRPRFRRLRLKTRRLQVGQML